MDPLALPELSLADLRSVVGQLVDADLDVLTNCEPWTLRRLASHALNNQLLWGGVVTGEALVSVDVARGTVPYNGDLAAYAEEVTDHAYAIWKAPHTARSTRRDWSGRPTIKSPASSWTDATGGVGSRRWPYEDPGFTYQRSKGQKNCVMTRTISPERSDRVAQPPTGRHMVVTIARSRTVSN